METKHVYEHFKGQITLEKICSYWTFYKEKFGLLSGTNAFLTMLNNFINDLSFHVCPWKKQIEILQRDCQNILNRFGELNLIEDKLKLFSQFEFSNGKVLKYNLAWHLSLYKWAMWKQDKQEAIAIFKFLDDIAYYSRKDKSLKELLSTLAITKQPEIVENIVSDYATKKKLWIIKKS